MDVEKIKLKISQMIEQGTVSEEVLRLIINEDGSVLPIETILWDYKVKFDNSAHGFKKILKSLVSFHNTHGGYLVFGIDETKKDTEFVATGISSGQLDQQKLSGQFDKYFGKRISLVYRELPLKVAGEERLFGLLFIPKRSHSERSLAPILAANDEGGKKILERYAIYFRTEDECKQVISTDDFVFISSERNFGSFDRKKALSKVFIENNLPDKAFICPVFVGRLSIIKELWAWLADELSHSKVLAADGGKGKTSIAYEFCQLLITSRVEGIEQIIWLTAKNRQFKAMFDEYVGTPETHYTGVESLLVEICLRTGSLAAELDDMSINQLTKQAKVNLELYPSFVVIDDVDSNSPDEQKRILEVARTIASEQSKVLLTTRVNTIFSLETSISVPGMEGVEYTQLINTLCDRFKLPRLSDKKIKKLEVSSEGSPLFSESILRLFKQGSSIDDAINEWSNKSGEAVREAALKKEVSELSLEAKKVLVTVSTVGTCSKTELHQLTDMEYFEIGKALEELDLLFLVSGVPFIESEPRFECSSSIAKLTLGLVDQLIPEAKEFLVRIKKVFHGLQSNSKKYHPRVGEAVRQCNALLKAGKHADARDTLNTLINQPEFKENKDLHFLAAAIEFSDPLAEQLAVSNAFQTAYIKGQRKQQFFDQWYDYAVEHESNLTVLDICRNAIKTGYTYDRWADRYLASAESALESAHNYNNAIEGLKDAYFVFLNSKTARGAGRDWEQFKRKCQQTLDKLCELCDRVNDLRVKATIVMTALRKGDLRTQTCLQLIDVSSKLRQSPTPDAALLDEIFSSLSEIQEVIGAQKNPRKALISQIQSELMKHAVADTVA